MQRRNLLADAEANRIRVTAAADAERMRSEAALLNKSPLLINKIMAERLSDKIQVMMVPSDGKYFFANDVFRGLGGKSGLPIDGDEARFGTGAIALSKRLAGVPQKETRPEYIVAERWRSRR